MPPCATLARHRTCPHISPSVMHSKMVPVDSGDISNDFASMAANPNQMRWNPLPLDKFGQQVIRPAPPRRPVPSVQALSVTFLRRVTRAAATADERTGP